MSVQHLVHDGVMASQPSGQWSNGDKKYLSPQARLLLLDSNCSIGDSKQFSLEVQSANPLVTLRTHTEVGGNMLHRVYNSVRNRKQSINEYFKLSCLSVR